MVKLDQVVQGVEGGVCSGEFNGKKTSGNVCGGCSVRPLSGKAILLTIS